MNRSSTTPPALPFPGFTTASSVHTSSTSNPAREPDNPFLDKHNSIDDGETSTDANNKQKLSGFSSALHFSLQPEHFSRSPSPSLDFISKRKQDSSFLNASAFEFSDDFNQGVFELDTGSANEKPNLLATFSTGRGKSLVSSKSALKEAEARRKRWDDEDNDGEDDAFSSQSHSAPVSALFSKASSALRLSPSQRETFVGQKRPNRSKETKETDIDLTTSALNVNTPTPITAASLMMGLKGKGVARPFRSPLLSREGDSAPTAGFATPSRAHRTDFVNPTVDHFALETPVRQAARSTPPQFLTTTPVRRGVPKKFTTPFKPGMAPGEPGRALLDEKLRRDGAITIARVDRTTTSPSKKKKERRIFFDLSA
jgi:breast cancer 2 susceptibility protein